MPREKYVIDMDDYFNDRRFTSLSNNYERWAILTEDEVSVITKEIERCRNDFVHCASNWFRIASKSGESMMFELWDGQIIVFEKLREMHGRGKHQWVVVIKSRQLGMSQLGCALGAHKCFFSSNQNGLIMSEDEKKTVSLWNDYTLNIYRQLPWFMQADYIAMTQKEGIKLGRNVKDGRGIGLNSGLRTETANSSGYVAQGSKLNFFHGSEFTSWPAFDDIVERGVENSLYDDRETIAILESTAKGSGTSTHAFWNRMVRMGDKATWEPVFLPFFMDRTHVMAPPKGWRPDEKGDKRREAVKSKWVRCDSKYCRRYFSRMWGMQDQSGLKCRFCKAGTFREFHISDEQLYWMWFKEQNASNPKVVQQEQAISAEEAFLSMDDKVFSDAAIEFAAWCIEKGSTQVPYTGFFDKHGIFHGYQEGRRCENGEPNIKCINDGCNADHSRELRHFTVWEKPIQGAQYYIGGDVSEGTAKDYHVFVVNKKGHGGQDIQVAAYRENRTTPYDLSYRVNHLGRWYNNAEVAIEYAGGGQTTADVLLNTLQYPNIYTRKISGDFSKTIGHGKHWVTNVASKPKLIAFMERWLREELFVIRDPILLEELRYFTRERGKTQGEIEKEKEKKKASADVGHNDDYVMAAMISLYVTHQNDYDEDGGVVPFKVDQYDPDSQAYVIDCMSCGKRVGCSDPRNYRNCIGCNSMNLIARMNMGIKADKINDPYQIKTYDSPASEYDVFSDTADYGKPYLGYW